jgi:mono/diheme cytochrome c family protein
MMRNAIPMIAGAAFGALSLAACAPSPQGPTQASPAAPPAPAPRVPNLVQGVCGDCHGVEPPFLSPNPDAPSFEAIANSAGLTGKSLTAWLIDAHNYPEFMEFELSEAEARQVADYMVTLQREDYEPAP